MLKRIFGKRPESSESSWDESSPPRVSAEGFFDSTLQQKIHEHRRFQLEGFTIPVRPDLRDGQTVEEWVNELNALLTNSERRRTASVRLEEELPNGWINVSIIIAGSGR